MAVYYNEFDPKAAQWLRNLIAAGLLPKGDVDERSIVDVRSSDLAGYTQCHFFAGIGGWLLALQLAGWESTRPVWTGSCPCQPFSSAGNQKGKTDERHLWPVWFGLIRECRPATIFGEQVSGAIAHGWLDDVYQGLEGEGYACGAAVLPACSVGAPHKRDRLWFVADTTRGRWKQGNENAGGLLEKPRPIQERGRFTNGAYALGDSGSCGCSGDARGRAGQESANRHIQHEDVGNTNGNGCDQGRCGIAAARSDGIIGNDGTLANAERLGQPRSGEMGKPIGAKACEVGETNRTLDDSAGHWSSGEWIDCLDGKARLVEPGIPLLAHGVSYRVVRLRAYGNAIIPQVAAEFIAAYMEARAA